MLWRWCGINISSGWMLRSGNASGRESGTNSRGSWLGRGKKSWRRPRRRVGSAGQAAAMAVAATYLASWASLGGGKRRLVLRKMGLRRLSFLDLFSLYVFCLRGFGRRRLVERSAYRSLLTKIFERTSKSHLSSRQHGAKQASSKPQSWDTFIPDCFAATQSPLPDSTDARDQLHHAPCFSGRSSSIGSWMI